MELRSQPENITEARMFGFQNKTIVLWLFQFIKESPDIVHRNCSLGDT